MHHTSPGCNEVRAGAAGEVTVTDGTSDAIQNTATSGVTVENVVPACAAFLLLTGASCVCGIGVTVCSGCRRLCLSRHSSPPAPSREMAPVTSPLAPAGSTTAQCGAQ